MLAPCTIALFTIGHKVSSQSADKRPRFEKFEVATIKPTPPDWKGGRYIRMISPQRFFAPNFSVRALIAAAYGLSPPVIRGGPAWLDADRYDINAVTPGDVRPNLDDQMAMLRELLVDRFKLTFHREQREFSVYALTINRNGPKLKASAAPVDDPPELVNIVYPGEGVRLPARNATMGQFAAMMQRSIFDRPVLDRTGLPGRYDFDLEWTPDEFQFDGTLKDNPESTKPGIFAALQEQLGLKLEATRGPVLAMIIDGVTRPSEN